MYIVRMLVKVGSGEKETFFGDPDWKSDTAADLFGKRMVEQGNLFGTEPQYQVIKLMSPGDVLRPARQRHSPTRPTDGGTTE